MIYLSIALFALSAVFGLGILIKWLSKKEAPKPVIFSHGIAAVLGLVVLIIFAVQHPNQFPKISLILFAVAAVAGIFMFVRDLGKKPHPMTIAFIHALVAVAGFLSLLYFAFA